MRDWSSWERDVSPAPLVRSRVGGMGFQLQEAEDDVGTCVVQEGNREQAAGETAFGFSIGCARQAAELAGADATWIGAVNPDDHAGDGEALLGLARFGKPVPCLKQAG